MNKKCHSEGAQRPKSLLPKLRFPEFQDSPAWEKKTLGELGDVVASGDLNTEYFSPTPSLQYIYPVFSNSIGQEGLYGYYSVSKYPKDSVTITARGTLGVAFLRKQDFMGIGRLIVVSDLKDTNPKFLTEGWNHLVIIPQEVTSIPQLTAITAKSIALPFPSLPEQQKIADCLTALDDLIAAQSQKVEALQAYKKGLMQNLFPAEGESVPRLRFPEFESAGGWETKTLGELGDVFMCKRIFAEETNTSNGVPFFKIGTLGGKPDAFISKDLFDEYKSKYNFPRKGEILITCSGTVGKCLVYDGNDAYYQDSNIVWIDNPTLEISNEFLYNILLNVDWGKLNSTTITRIYMSDLRDLSIVYPANPKEQQRIAELLSAVDEEISAQGEAVAALKVHKRGLMQRLFV